MGYEAGFCGFGIQRELAALGIECLVLNAADIPKGDKYRKQKNDKRDARTISQHLSNKRDVKTLYIPATQWEHARTLVGRRFQTTKPQTFLGLYDSTNAVFAKRTFIFQQ